MTEDKEVAVSNGEEKTETAENEEERTENAENDEEETELESAIIRQVEYYFGDINLPRDKFLREQVQLDEGWIPLEILIKFNRLSKLTVDLDVIAKALNKSTSGLLEVSEDNKKVRRHPEMPVPEMNEERRKEMMSRTIYAKGFPKDSTLDELLAFFKQFDDVENIIMRKYQERNTKKRLFKGSVFVLFKSKEQAEKFINTKDVKYKENPLIVLWQDDYVKQKQDEYIARKDQKEKKQKEKKEEETPEKPEFKLPTGSVLKLTGTTDKTTREDIRNGFTALGAEIAYIDFNLGDTEGWVRLSKENSAKEFAEKHTDGKIKISDTDVEFKLLEGDDEKAYLDKTVEEMTKRRRNMKNNRYNKGKNYKGKQGRKRKQDNQDDAPPPSKVKTD